MPDFLLTSVTTTAQSLDGAQTGLVTRNGGVWSDGADAVVATAGNNSLTNDGYLYALNNSSASAIDANGSTFTLLNGKDGVIAAPDTSDGVIDADVTGSLSVTNHGAIYSTGADAISFLAADSGAFFQLNNTGEISANSTVALDIDPNNGYFYIQNSGSITARRTVVDVVTDAAASFFSTVINSGVITSFESYAFEFALGNNGTLTFINSGEITGEFGSFRLNPSRTTDVILTNTGLMADHSGGVAILLSGGDDYVTNAGVIYGDVVLGEGTDVFDGRGGTVTGSVSGGDANDLYIVDDDTLDLVELAGEGTDEVQTNTTHALGDNFENLTLIGSADATGVGNSENNVMTGNGGSNRLGASTGNDTVDAGAGNDSVYGGGGNDSLRGGEGDDWISAGAANDILLGDDGNDVLMGQRGADLLNGGDGSDVLIGGSGNDTLAGGREDDTLIGGEGADQLNGASGIDTFVWNSVSESANGGARDRIIGFETGTDLLDVRNAVQGEFDINIGTGFTAGGIASVRTFEAGADTRVFVDFDGNGSTDMRIDIQGVLGVTEVDFLV